jgi:hypothetical protein
MLAWREGLIASTNSQESDSRLIRKRTAGRLFQKPIECKLRVWMAAMDPYLLIWCCRSR